jgi:hypothetical protein
MATRFLSKHGHLWTAVQVCLKREVLMMATVWNVSLWHLLVCGLVNVYWCFWGAYSSIFRAEGSSYLFSQGSYSTCICTIVSVLSSAFCLAYLSSLNDMFLQNVGELLPHYMVSHSKIYYFSETDPFPLIVLICNDRNVKVKRYSFSCAWLTGKWKYSSTILDLGTIWG